MAAARQLKLGFILHGNGVGWGDWCHPQANAAAGTSPQGKAALPPGTGFFNDRIVSR